MSINPKFCIFLLIFFVLNVALVSASDINETDFINADNNTDILSDDLKQDLSTNDSISQSNSTLTVEKSNPKITVKTTQINSRDTLTIYLKDSSGKPLESKKLTALINNKKYSISTNSKGAASFNVVLPAKTYKLSVSFKGDDDFKSVSKSFSIKVSKLSTKINPLTNFLVRGKYLYADLTRLNGDVLSAKQLIFKINGKTYTKTTNKNGRAKLKMNFYPSVYSLKIKFNGNQYYKPSKSSFKFHVMYYTTITIANSKLLSNGYLRVYLKDYSTSDISHKNLVIKIANKKFSKKTTSEGIVIFKPGLADKTYKVMVKYGNLWVSKKVKGIIGNAKGPLKTAIPLKNGVPDTDYMAGNYVMGDGSATYTLTKAQYKEVLKRDSYCLFLNKKLTKYTFFKTKQHPSTNHIIKREKWNVIERELNTKLVKANKYNYWPSKLTVSLKGKSYTYSEVRDVQNTEYTCGPASSSVCSQVLRNYLSEYYIAKVAGSKEVVGTPCHGLIKALAKNNFECEYFYKSSYSYALNELQKGGCALVFHTKNHYVCILDISKDGKKVLVSNSYKEYYNIPTKWLTVKYMKTRYVPVYDDGLIVRLNYSLSNSTKDSINSFYASMGKNWVRQNTNAMIGI